MFSSLLSFLPTKVIQGFYSDKAAVGKVSYARASLLGRSLSAVSGAFHFVLRHPLQVLTAGLAAQSAVVSALNQTIPLSELDGQAGFALMGMNAGDYSGYSVGAAGDLNGDGIADLIIGAIGANNWAGASYVIFGHENSWTTPFSLASLDGTNGFELTGAAVGDESGQSVGPAGDVNGDSIDDLIIGAWFAYNHAGASYVLFGHTGPWTTPFSLASLDGTNGFELSGIATGDESGQSVGPAGDVNGDGIDDLIIGAAGAYQSAGSTYIIFGHGGPWATPFNLAGLDGINGLELRGVVAGDESGHSVGPAGDVNGDGIADVIIGAWYSYNITGSAYVVFGHEGSWATPFNLAGLDGINGFELKGVNVNHYVGTGISVRAAGDVNGDGIDDVIIGAIGANDFRGASYIIFGHLGSWTTPFSLASLDGTNGFELIAGGGETSGFSVSTAGDMNGDGIADLIIGAPGGDHVNDDAGVSYVIFGHRDSWTTPLRFSKLGSFDGFALLGAPNDKSGQA